MRPGARKPASPDKLTTMATETQAGAGKAPTQGTPLLRLRGGPPLLRLRGVSKSFGPVQALGSVDFEVHAGEVVALVGDNGAGKSTLIKAISGIQPGDEYEARWSGESVHLDTPQDATRLGIATVYQDLALCDNLDVVANLFLGKEQVE